MKKVFLDDLPRYNNLSSIKEERINWKESIGYTVKFIYNNIESEVKIMDSSKRYLYIKYLNNDNFKIAAESFRKCKLGKLLGICTSEFKIEINTIYKDEGRDIIIIDREYRKNNMVNPSKKEKWYRYECNKCTYKGWIVESSLNRGTGCNCCSKYRKIVVEGINSIVDTDPWMIPYFQGGYDEAKLYTRSSSQKILPVCPDCGRVKSKEMHICDIYRRHSIGCSCGDGYSYPNKIMFMVLEQLDVIFQAEYMPPWIKPLKYDFYFKLNNIDHIIEMDGGFHTKDNTRSGQSMEESQKIDKYKEEKAIYNNIQIIRIDSEKSELEYIKGNILNSSLKDFLNLDIIDWVKVEEFALSNLVLKACEFKRDNPDMSTGDIGNIMGLCFATIRRYLVKGSKIWNWAEYDSKKEATRSLCRGRVSQRKSVEIFKDNISLGIFKSCTDLVTNSKNIFGVQFLNSKISNVCNGKNNKHIPYVFKFVDNDIVSD